MQAPLPLLSIEHLRLETSRGTAVVDDVSFRMTQGEFLAVVGESGSGKTMLARAVVKLLPYGVWRTGGCVRFRGEHVFTMTESRLRALRGGAIGMVFQDPMLSLNPAMTVGAQLVEAQRMHCRLPSSELRDRAIEMMARVQIRNPSAAFRAFPHEFSGGMRQRIMLASAMLLRPGLLIADEPTTALDTLNQRDVLNLMAELVHANGTAVMLITHNLGLVGRYANRVIVMREGKVVEEGPAGALLRAPRHTYTHTLVNALPQRPIRPSFVRTGEPVVTVRGLKVFYQGRRPLFGRRPRLIAVRDVDLDVYPGEVVAVVGGSGSGKTTLGRAILGLLPIVDGKILVRGTNLLTADRTDRRAARSAWQLIFQDPHSSLDPRMRVRQIVAEPLRHELTQSAADQRQRVDEVLDQVGLAGYGDRFPHALSGGQRQRVAIARAVVRNPQFVVADEPVSALDMTVQKQVLSLFRSLQARYGFACLFITHDLSVVHQVADRVVVMQAGQVVEHGPYADVFDHPRHEYTRALRDAAPSLDFALTPEKRAVASAEQFGGAR